MSIVPNIDSKGVERISHIRGHDIQKLVQMLCADRLTRLQKDIEYEGAKMKKRHELIRFMHKAMRAINSATDPKTGKFTIEEGSDLEKIVDEAEKLKEAAETLKRESARREAEGDAEGAKELREQASEIEDAIDPILQLKKKKEFTREERELLLDSMRTVTDDLNTLNKLLLQKITRLNNDRHETLMLAKTIAKTLHETKTRIARESK